MSNPIKSAQTPASTAGGGQSKTHTKKMSEFPANVVPDGAFGKVDEAKVAKLKAKSNRPAPLKRKSKNSLEKDQKKKLVDARKAAKTKYQERTESFRKDRVYLKNRFATMQSHTARKMTEWASKLNKAKMPNTQTEKKIPSNFTLIYSVGPQNDDRRQEFRAFRKKEFAKLKTMKKEGKSIDITSVKVPKSKPIAAH